VGVGERGLGSGFFFQSGGGKLRKRGYLRRGAGGCDLGSTVNGGEGATNPSETPPSRFAKTEKVGDLKS